MRLKIGKGDQFLHLKSGTSFQIDMQSPLYFAENRGTVFPSVKTYSFTVPNTTHNRLLLGRPADLDNTEQFIDETGWHVQYDGYHILDGKIEVEEGLYQGNMKITFIAGLAGNLEVLKTLHLQDVFIPPVTLGDTTSEVLSSILDMQQDEDTNFVFPQIRVDADGELVDGTNDDEDNPLPTKYTFINYYNSDGYQLIGEDSIFSNGNTLRPFRATIAPQIKLRYLFEMILSHVDYQLAGIFDSHGFKDELNRLLLFSNYTLDQLVTLPDGDDVTFDDLVLQSEYAPANSLPNLKAADLFRAFVELFCLAPITDTTGRRLILVACQDLINTPAKINWTSKVDPNYQRQRKLEKIPNEFKYELPPENYGPDNEKKRRNAELDHYFVTLDDCNNTLLITDLGKFIYIEELNEFFTTAYSPFQTGSHLYLQPVGKDLGVVNEDNSISFSPVATTLHSITRTEIDGKRIAVKLYLDVDSVYDFYYGPRLTSAFYAKLQTPMQNGKALKEIIFLINRGFIADRDGGQSPYAGSSAYDHFGNVMGDLSLLWTGEHGIYERWWSKWIDALGDMRPVIYPTRMTAVDLANLDWREKVIIGQHAYFVKRIKITLTTDEIMTASVEYMQLK